MLTVSMPTWRTPPDLVARAVACVLDQTHTDLTLILIGDGVDPPRLPDYDERLVVFTLDRNRGRYYADAVAAAACTSEWFTIHDDDDISDPDRYRRMLAAAGDADVVAGAILDVTADGRQRILRSNIVPSPVRLNHFWHLSALYRTETIRGMIHPGFRVGYDSLLSSLLAWTANVVRHPEPLYRRMQRDASLTRHPDTGIGSPYRRAEVDRLTALLRRCHHAASRRRFGQQDRVREILADDAGVDLTAQVAADAARLRELLPAPPPPAPVDAGDVVVTILTGGRPQLLAETIDAVRHTAPGLLETARVIALNNGGDRATADVLASHRDVIDDRLSSNGPIAPIGPSISRLAAAAAGSDRRFWLHLEDDWRAVDDPGWLDRARGILATRREISQVRLRRSAEPVLPRHMVTGRPLVWRRQPGHVTSPDAHLTFNPSLLRTADIPAAFPCGGEQDAQRRWRIAGRRAAAQLVPGVFAHIGHDDSLRQRTGHDR